MRFNSKDFRQNNYFVLYDLEDNLICYFDNFEELSKYINYRCSALVYEFNHSNDFVQVIIKNEKYKLYTFVDKKKEISSFFYSFVEVEKTHD